MSLKRQTLWSILPLVSVTLVNIVSVPLFYRYLGAEMYAVWFYVATFVGAFGFMDFGIGVAVGRYVGVALGGDDVAAAREYWGTGNVIVLPLLAIMALIFTGMGVWFGPIWFNVAPANVTLLRWAFVVGGVGLFFAYYSQVWLMLSQAHLDFKFLGILRTVASLVQVLPSIPLAWATGNPLAILLWAAAVSILQLGVFIWHARRSYRWGFSFRQAKWQRAKEMAGYTSKTLLTLMVNAFGAADRFVLGRLAGAADFTHFNICTNVGGRIQGLSVAVMGPVFSQTNRAIGTGDRGSAAGVYDETFKLTFPWYLLLSVWFAIWHPVFLRLWLGEELASAVKPIFVPVIVASCLTAISNISSAQLGSLNRVGTGLIFNVGTVCLFVFAVLFGWRWGGLIGVAWAFLASRIALVCQDLFVIRLIGAKGWLAKSTWKHFAGQLAVGLAFSVSLLLFPSNSFWQLIPGALHLCAVPAWLFRKRLFPGHAKSKSASAPGPT